VGVRAEQVSAYTKNKLQYLIQESGKNNKAILAEIRKGVGKQPGEIPKLWGILFENMPEDMMGKGLYASKAEWAIYIALTLFAFHQQGHSVTDDCMHSSESSLGKAVAGLVTEEGKEERIIRRFNSMATADEISGVSYHLRNIIQLLREDGLKIDYAGLASDLYLYQFDDIAPSIRLKWGQDFYKELNAINHKEDNSNE